MNGDNKTPKMLDLYLPVLIIALNVCGLNATIRRERLPDCIK